MPLLLYGNETWTLYRKNINQLRTVQQRHLRRILKIKWDDYVSNEDVLLRADVEDIELTLSRNRLRWLGHVSRMRSESPVKELLYGEFVEGTRAIGRPKLRYKDTCKSILKHGLVLNEWQQTFANRSLWKDLVSRVCLNYSV